MSKRALFPLAGLVIAVSTAAIGAAQTPPAEQTEAGQAAPGTAQPAAQAQAPAGAESQPVSRRGRFSLYDVSSAFGYSSLGISGNSSNDPTLARLTADYYGMASLSAGYSSSNARGGTTLMYTPTYMQRVRFNELSSLNHLLTFSNRRQVAPTSWLTFGLSGSAASAEQIAFGTSQAGRLTQSNATAQELSEGLFGQHQSNNDVAHIVSTGGNDPLSVAIYGGRVLNSSGHLEYEWTPSTRTSVHSGISAFRAQPLSQDQGNVTPGLGLRSSGASANVGVSYSLSPRTTTGFGISHVRTRSAWMNNNTSSIEYSLGRRISPRWFTNVTAGVGRVSTVRSTLTERVPGSYTFSGSGSLGFRSRLHSLVGTYDRRAGDSYGVGAGSTTIAQLALSSSRPGRTWSTFTGGSYQAIQGSAFGEVRTWQVQGGFTQVVGTHASVSTSISYMSVANPGLPGLQSALSGYHARISFTWIPSGPERL